MTRSTATTRPPQIPGYQYVADIATGGYSVVYRYQQQSPRRDVAVKVLTGLSADLGPGQRDAEANAMAKLGNHPNIVQVIVADVTADGQHFIIMPYYPGRSLAEQVNDGQLAVRKVLRVGVGIAGALDAAHRFGLLHRDIKPANILIDEYGTARLTDFGIAGWVGPDQQMDTGGLSLPWSPAEVIAGGESRRASDIYSLGATLWHLLVGQPPYAQADDTRSALEWRIQNTPAPATGRPDMPPEFEDLLARMLARRPDRRPESAGIVAAELQRIETAFGGPAPADMSWHGDVTNETLRPSRMPQFEPTSARERQAPRPPASVTPLPMQVNRAPSAPAPAPLSTPARLEPASEHTILRGSGEARVRNLAPISEHTQLRQVATPAPVVPVEPGRRTKIAWWVWALAVVIVCAVVITGVVIATGGSPPPKPTPTVVASQNAGVDELPPGVPTIIAKRSGGSLTFTWTYDAAKPSDTFLWRVFGSDHTSVAKQPSVTIPDKPGTQLCIQVKVVRASGGFASPDWSIEGCGS